MISADIPISVFFKAIQHRLFEGSQNNNLLISLNKTLEGSNEYALLDVDATLWIQITGFYNAVFYRSIFVLQNNPAIFMMGLFAGEEKGNVGISRKIYEISFPTEVLDFS